MSVLFERGALSAGFERAALSEDAPVYKIGPLMRGYNVSAGIMERGVWDVPFVSYFPAPSSEQGPSIVAKIIEALVCP